jgi:hypothetical protein
MHVVRHEPHYRPRGLLDRLLQADKLAAILKREQAAKLAGGRLWIKANKPTITPSGLTFPASIPRISRPRWRMAYRPSRASRDTERSDENDG